MANKNVKFFVIDKGACDKDKECGIHALHAFLLPHYKRRYVVRLWLIPPRHMHRCKHFTLLPFLVYVKKKG